VTDRFRSARTNHLSACKPRRLRFDREAAWGMRLDIPAGTAVRFEPGVEREVQLVRIGGGAADSRPASRGLPATSTEAAVAHDLTRARYAALFGPDGRATGSGWPTPTCSSR